MPSDPVTLPYLTNQGLNALIVAVVIAGAIGLMWLMLTSTERKRPLRAEDWMTALAWTLGPIWVLLLGATLWGLWQVFNGIEGATLSDTSFGLGALIAAFLGAPFVIYGTWLKHKTNRLEQEGHMTDRINKAVEQLGADKIIERDGKKESVPNIEVRMGAILSLERIAQDSTIHDKGRDHVRVMEILCAYVRENTSIPDLSSNEDDDGPFRVRTDIQMAIDVIKRRSPPQEKIEEDAKYRLDLRECDFRGADLSKGSFRGAIFVRCRFEFSQLNDSDFSGAEFSESVLNYVWAVRTKFIGARFHLIRIDKPQPVAGGFVRSINLGELKGASFAGANISAIQYLRENTATFGTKDTILSVEMERQREEIIKKAKNSGVTSIGNVESTGDVSSTFASWSPYEISDGMTGHLLTEFYDRVGLTGWPFRN